MGTERKPRKKPEYILSAQRTAAQRGQQMTRVLDALQNDDLPALQQLFAEMSLFENLFDAKRIQEVYGRVLLKCLLDGRLALFEELAQTPPSPQISESARRTALQLSMFSYLTERLRSLSSMKVFRLLLKDLQLLRDGSFPMQKELDATDQQRLKDAIEEIRLKLHIQAFLQPLQLFLQLETQLHQTLDSDESVFFAAINQLLDDGGPQRANTSRIRLSSQSFPSLSAVEVYWCCFNFPDIETSKPDTSLAEIQKRLVLLYSILAGTKLEKNRPFTETAAKLQRYLSATQTPTVAPTDLFRLLQFSFTEKLAHGETATLLSDPVIRQAVLTNLIRSRKEAQQLQNSAENQLLKQTTIKARTTRM